MKILLTGGSGFIGKNIKESFLNETYTIITPSRSELDCFDDKSVASFFAHQSFDIVIHSAAKPGHRNAQDTTGILMANSRMIFNLLKYKNSWGKLFNMGSGAIYDMLHYEPKMKEEYFGTHIPRDEHGYNKYIFGLLSPHYNNQVIDFRIFGLFGKYEDYAIRYISNAICKTLFNLPITLGQNRKFDYLFIDDLMPVLDYFIIHEAKYSAYNITPDFSIELLEIARNIQARTSPLNKIIVHKEGLGTEYSGDNARLKNEIKSISFTPIDHSIDRLYKWYSDNHNLINKDYLLVDK